MAKKQGLDDIIKGAAKLVGKATKKGAKKTTKSAPAKTPAKKPPQPPKRPTGGKPPAVGSKGTGRVETRGGMNTKELDAYLKKQYKDSANYFEDNRGFWREEARKKAKNELKKRGKY